ncbi:RodZ domain-containing protein [Desulfovibrio sp. 86]|uniref:Cytoskeleton protein RodZ-like C-terminal domain-containing protein n=1 Tax=uncultured Desulfovibrio sp. TaxID=167968 RepID=A0A212LAC2_9BACT|nr:RodZ domain-containing protein [Desulfovibrio sp. 86]SCM74486.1 conserved hypothetical protein [uncultured Desulfovibrio sp.]VZH34863.1 conserved protein of unknown function [Desulfovibrio sp. 86]
MTLEELGAVLRAEREKRGLSIEDAANHLKIGARLLRALEAGDSASLPHLAYTKGFIRSYSAYVGLSAEEISAALSALEAENEEALIQQTPLPDVTLTPRRNFKPFLSVFVVLLLGIGVYLVWQHGALDVLTSQTRRQAQPAPMQSPDNAETPPLGTEARNLGREARQSGAAGQLAATATDSGPQAGRSAAPAASGAQRSETAGAQAPVPAATAATSGPATTPGTAATTGPAAASAATSAATTPQTPVTGPHKVIITATEECWVHSNADHTDTRQFSLRKGDTFALTFTKSLELKLGNAGGVRLRYDGEELPPVGASGQVRTLTFPPALP